MTTKAATTWYSQKILPQHLERLAVVYVRQATVQQVLDHQESTRLQYGLVERAEACPDSRPTASLHQLGAIPTQSGAITREPTRCTIGWSRTSGQWVVSGTVSVWSVWLSDECALSAARTSIPMWAAGNRLWWRLLPGHFWKIIGSSRCQLGTSSAFTSLN